MIDMIPVQVKGYDEEGNEIKRILSTVLKARNGTRPDVFMAQTEINLIEDEPLHIKCRVDSQLKVVISIAYEDHQLRQWESK